MSYGSYLSISRKDKTPGGIKAERQHHVITHNPQSFQPPGMLLVVIPKLAYGDLIVPNTMKLAFNLNITGSTDAWFVNNIAANLIQRLVIKWGGKVLLDIDNYYLFETYKDLWLTSNQRIDLIRRGISEINVRKLRSNASSASTTNSSDNRINKIYGNKYEILLNDCSFLTDQHPFYPYIYKEQIEYDIYFNPQNLVIDKTTAADSSNYNLTNITFEYDTVYEPALCNIITQLSDSQGGISYLYDYVTYIGMNPINKSDTSFSLDVKHPRKSIKGILMLFEIPPTEGSRDSENFYCPEISRVDITLDGKANRIFEQGYLQDQQYTEAQKLCLKQIQKGLNTSDMTCNKFYGDANNAKFCLWIDCRSSEDNNLHGSGHRLMSSNNGFLIQVTKNNTGSGAINVHTYLIADAQFTLINRLATDPQFE